jgi:hypothetical protein
VSIFYSDAATDVTTNLATFINAIKGLFPNAVTWSIPAAGDTIDTDTDQLNGAWTGGTAASITATGGTGNYVAGTGGMVRWITGAVVNGRKVQGRTYLVPLITGAFDSDGTLNNTNVATIQAAATTLAGAGKLFVYSRPHGSPPVSGADQVLAAVVPDRVTSLRTRRS